MSVFKEIKKAGSPGTTQFFRLSAENATVETNTSADFYAFKGNVNARADLPTGNVITGDVYYIEDEGRVVFWAGGSWANVETYAINYNYNNASNKPSINGHLLIGSLTAEDLDLQPAGDYLTEVPSEYITEEELTAENYATKNYVIEQVANAEHFHREVVDALPLQGKDNVLYLVPKQGTDKDIYNEYIWTGTEYELLGTTATDLTNYYNKIEVDGLLDKKVNTKAGFGLSSNDYTATEKNKLASLENYDDTQIKADLAALHNYDDTSIKNDITALKTAENALKTSVDNLDEEIKNQTTYVRLIKSGDTWTWMSVKGDTLTYTQARELLGQEECFLILEGLENDGKTMPTRYNIDGDTIHAWARNHEGESIYITSTAAGVSMTIYGATIHMKESVTTVNTLPVDAHKGEMRYVEEDKIWYLYNGSQWIATDKDGNIDLSIYLAKNNTIPYEPTADYNPATKIYVDDRIPTKMSQLTNDKEYVTKTTNDLTHYYNKTNSYNKSEVDALIAAIPGGGGGGSSVAVVDNLESTSTEAALSANQGRILKDYIDNGIIDGGTL